MGYSEALSFDSNAAVRSRFDSRSSAESASREPIDFGKVFREKYSESLDEHEAQRGTSDTADNTTFFTGAAMDVFTAVPQMKTNAFEDEFGAFRDHEDLDSAISFDEISELDDITDTVAAARAEEAANDKFRGFDELSDAMSAEDDEEEDLSMFSDLEELIM